MAIFIVSCEESGVVGGAFVEDQTEITKSVLYTGPVQAFNDPGYTGRLRALAVGAYDDPLFGEVRALGYMKPSISQEDVENLFTNDEFELRLVFDSTVYGDPESPASFNIYRTMETWRGNEMRYGNEIQFNDQSLVGEFTVNSPTDTIVVQLSSSFRNQYRTFLESQASDRDGIYRESTFGLVIVPEPGVNQILHAKMRPESEENDSNLQYVRFRVTREALDDEGQPTGDTEFLYQPAIDWGSSVVRTPPSSQPLGISVHNTLEQFIEIEPDLDPDDVSSRNFSTAELVLHLNRDVMDLSLPEGHIRPEVDTAILYQIPSAERKSDWIFSRSPVSVAEYNEDQGSFRFDVSNYLTNVLFGSIPPGNFYVTVESQSGILYSSHIYDDNAGEALRPKFVITAAQ
ncbi:MAG: hypothetical protein WD094_00280 [Balneolaceae bacterium]